MYDFLAFTLPSFCRMFKDFMSMFVQQQSGKIWVDSMSSYAVVNSVPEERRVTELSPIQLRKSVKNSVEIECMKRAHVSFSSVNRQTSVFRRIISLILVEIINSFSYL